MWSVIWYLGAFGGLVTFFVVVTCSEWCFGNHMYTRHGTNEIYVNAFQASSFQESHQRAPETPPPPYHLFAPPSYSDLFGSVKGGKRKISKINIFIIPVHKVRRSLSAPAAS